MALKDLIADKSAVTEEAIEGVVSGFVRYYPDTKEVDLTPGGLKLKNRQKVLVYLVALLGWKYVTDETVEQSARPAEIEQALGIAGGTLRPLLRELADERLVSSDGGAYSVRVANLEVIKKMLADNPFKKDESNSASVAKV